MRLSLAAASVGARTRSARKGAFAAFAAGGRRQSRPLLG